MTAAEYRAQFDAVVTFANGGGLRAEAFRVDVPGPEAAGSAVRPYLTREWYAPGTEFQIDEITMVGNTGTYLDSPLHRYAGGPDLAALPPECCAGLPAVLARTRRSGVPGSGPGAPGGAGGNRAGGAAAYSRRCSLGPGWVCHRCPVPDGGVRSLAGHGARLDGTDSVNIDDIGDGRRPALDPAGRRHPGRGAPHRARPAASGRVPVHRRSSPADRRRDLSGPRVRYDARAGTGITRHGLPRILTLAVPRGGAIAASGLVVAPDASIPVPEPGSGEPCAFV